MSDQPTIAAWSADEQRLAWLRERGVRTFDGGNVSVSVDMDAAWEWHLKADPLAEHYVTLHLDVDFCSFQLEFRHPEQVVVLAEHITAAVSRAAGEYERHVIKHAAAPVCSSCGYANHANFDCRECLTTRLAAIEKREAQHA